MCWTSNRCAVVVLLSLLSGCEGTLASLVSVSGRANVNCLLSTAWTSS